jgi:spore cortex biosynthesis protein YabQ
MVNLEGGSRRVEYVTTQLSSFLILLLTGLVLGGFFDLYRTWRGTVKVSRKMTVVGDLLFWLVALITATLLIFWSTWLELRLYVWLAVALGLVLYLTTFSSLFIPWFVKLWRILLCWPRQMGWLKQSLWGRRRPPRH